MQFKEAFALNDGEPSETTCRYVYSLPGGNKMVVKSFPITGSKVTSHGYTVKFWGAELDYKRTVSSWATKRRFQPSDAMIDATARVAIRLLEECGFVPFALVNRR